MDTRLLAAFVSQIVGKDPACFSENFNGEPVIPIGRMLHMLFL
jgi:hypothetical protein